MARKKGGLGYKDPRWQKLRLKVMERDEFKCRQCNSGDTTLNVHHHWYEKDGNVWDSPMQALVTLCEDCHREREEWIQALKISVGPLVIDLLRRVVAYAHVIDDGALPDYEAYQSEQEARFDFLRWSGAERFLWRRLRKLSLDTEKSFAKLNPVDDSDIPF